MRIISLKIDEELLKQVDEIAKFLGKTRSEIIRTALTKYVNEIEIDKDNRVLVVKKVWVF